MVERQVAFKLSIGEFLSAEYVKTDGWNPNYLKTYFGEVSRINIIGTILSNEMEQFGEIAYRNMLIDDGTGSVYLRNFENPNAFSGINVSDTVLVIGKPREYNGERYILAEIVKRVDPRWLEVRRAELALRKPQTEEKNMVEEEIVSQDQVDTKGAIEKVYQLIQELDSGNGADYNEVITRAGVPDAEAAVKKLLERGDIFEIKAGRLKVL